MPPGNLTNENGPCDVCSVCRQTQKDIKKFGLQNLSAYVTMTNLFCWTKYSGIDPEIASGVYTPSYDTSSTPRSRQVTATISMGF
jgi:hypothetical protein